MTQIWFEACKRLNLDQMKRLIEACEKRLNEAHEKRPIRPMNRHAKRPNHLGQMKRLNWSLACLKGPLNFGLFSCLNCERPLIGWEMSHDKVTSSVPLHLA